MHEAGCAFAQEYADDVKAHGIEVRLLLGQVLLCEGANGGLLAGGGRVERATEAGPRRSLTSVKTRVLVQMYKHPQHPSWCSAPCSNRTVPSD